ncbi:MAG: adenosylmethionine decarboxylase [Hyphomicrobium sp.]|jgi:S-adenosylmethionine decarboxylase|uniref:adenosylmethionine decarboxylase n=2 Tax=Hyphomicrobium TaxID=81 RepID=UPI0034521B35|nr:adenosylmethionine decarboxylase [Hyphomicrobium sp.]
MAFNDTLFQLGMDLTRSSPAQKEDLSASAQGAHAALEDAANDRISGRHSGRHLLVDLYGAHNLDDTGHVERTLRKCVDAAGATLLHLHVHALERTGGVTGVAVLAESHISIHSWPDQGYAALDVFMSGDADPQRAVSVLTEAFGAARVIVKTHTRGEAPGKAATCKAGAKAGKAPKGASVAKPRAARKAKAA